MILNHGSKRVDCQGTSHSSTIPKVELHGAGWGRYRLVSSAIGSIFSVDVVVRMIWLAPSWLIWAQKLLTFKLLLGSIEIVQMLGMLDYRDNGISLFLLAWYNNQFFWEEEKRIQFIFSFSFTTSFLWAWFLEGLGSRVGFPASGLPSFSFPFCHMWGQASFHRDENRIVRHLESGGRG